MAFLLVIFLSTTNAQRYEYKYSFYNNLAGQNISNELDTNGEPEFLVLHYDDRRLLESDPRYLGDLGDESIWTRLGVMITEGDPLRTNNQGANKNFTTDAPFTVILYIYVTKYDQDGCLFGKVETDEEYDGNVF